MLSKESQHEATWFDNKIKLTTEEKISAQKWVQYVIKPLTGDFSQREYMKKDIWRPSLIYFVSPFPDKWKLHKNTQGIMTNTRKLYLFAYDLTSCYVREIYVVEVAEK